MVYFILSSSHHVDLYSRRFLTSLAPFIYVMLKNGVKYHDWQLRSAQDLAGKGVWPETQYRGSTSPLLLGKLWLQTMPVFISHIFTFLNTKSQLYDIVVILTYIHSELFDMYLTLFPRGEIS